MGARPLMAALFSTAALAAGAARGGEVTIGLVTQKDGKVASLEAAHEIRRSPYGGWVVTTWPLGMRVGNSPILDYKDSLLERAWGMERGGEAGDGTGAADKLLKELGVEGPPVVPGVSRRSTAKVELHDGKHVLAPGDLRFALERGKLSSDDPRVSVHADRGLVQVVCWPVTFRVFEGERSAAAPMTLAYEGADLLAGVLKPVEDAAKQGRPKAEAGAAEAPSFRRVTLYLPPTPAGRGYLPSRASAFVGDPPLFMKSFSFSVYCIDCAQSSTSSVGFTG